MTYKNKHFLIENVSAEKLARKYGTPLYVYSYNKLRNNIKNFQKYFKVFSPMICFSVKSNSNLKLLNIIGRSGLGADVVSKGELLKALKANIKPKNIVFSGVSKTIEELKFAISKKIFLVAQNLKMKLLRLKKLQKKKKNQYSLDLILILTQKLSKISTGKKENKFDLTKKEFLKLIKKYRDSNFILFV